MTPRQFAHLICSSLRLLVSAVQYVVLWLACFTSNASAIVTSDTPGSHVVAPGQITFGMNLDGVVALAFEGLENQPVCSAALISDRHILTAAHCADNGLERAVFDLLGGQVFIDLDPLVIRLPPQWTSDLAEGADLAILMLAADAPPQVPRYPLYAATDEVGRQAVIAGFGLTGHGAIGEVPHFFGNKAIRRAGLNRIDARGEDFDNHVFPAKPGFMLALDFDSGIAANNTLSIFGVSSDLGFGADEVAAASGDSGGPVFIDGAIAGVVSGGIGDYDSDVNDLVDASWGELGFLTRVSTFQEFIVTATDGQAVFVPEPATWLLFACGLVCSAWIAARTRRSV